MQLCLLSIQVQPAESNTSETKTRSYGALKFGTHSTLRLLSPRYLKQLNYWEVLTKMGSGISALDLAEAYFMKQNYLEMGKALSSVSNVLSAA